jgi:ribosomal protein S18 acetylase RimI-like enzyme
MDNLFLKELTDYTTDLYDLLFLADPSQEQIDTYLNKSTIYGAYNKSEELIGVYVLYPINSENVEIKNIAVKEDFQRSGVGTVLLRDAINRAKTLGFRKINIGTANSSIHQLYLYQKEGFEIDYVIKNFFVDNYNESIIENGIQAKDMIMLVKHLY